MTAEREQNTAARGWSRSFWLGIAAIVLVQLGSIGLGLPSLGAVVLGTLLFARELGLFQLTIINNYAVQAQVEAPDDADAWKNGSGDEDDGDAF